MNGCKLMAWCIAAGLLLAGGCEPSKKEFKPVPKGTKVVAEEHHEHGPHDGHLIELGEEEYHAELVYDAQAKKVTVYILGPDAKKAQPIDQKELALNLMIDGKPVQFQIPAAPEKGEPEGKSSRFELTGNEQIAGHVKDIEEMKGRLNVTIGGKPYSGDLAHDHDEHEHGAEEKGKHADDGK